MASAVVSDSLDMRQAAAKSGRSYERFRKIWPELVRKKGFPPPFETGPYAWREAPVEAWRLAQEAAIKRKVLLGDAAAAAAANDHQPERRTPSNARINRQRTALRQKMGGR